MKFVTVRDLRLKPGEIWKRLEMERELIITSNGKPIALLTGINEDTMERTCTTLRRTRAILAMEEMQRTSALGSISYLRKRSRLKLKWCGVAGSENRAQYQCPSFGSSQTLW
ncbi:MAG: type II toxin-antitoxin system Phd/YefM family antitoxin [Dehalococcoidia bacterium]|nr:hypothetical protein [Chloroflexota bacterium]